MSLSVPCSAGLRNIGRMDWPPWFDDPAKIAGFGGFCRHLMSSAIEGLALERPPLPISSIYRQIRVFAAQKGEPAPNYGTVYALVRSLPTDLLTNRFAERATLSLCTNTICSAQVKMSLLCQVKISERHWRVDGTREGSGAG